MYNSYSESTHSAQLSASASSSHLHHCPCSPPHSHSPPNQYSANQAPANTLQHQPISLAHHTHLLIRRRTPTEHPVPVSRLLDPASTFPITSRRGSFEVRVVPLDNVAELSVGVAGGSGGGEEGVREVRAFEGVDGCFESGLRRGEVSEDSRPVLESWSSLWLA